MGVQVVTRSSYPGGFIGDLDVDNACITEKFKGWTDFVQVMARVAHRHTHTAYDGLQKSLQQDWGFSQNATTRIRDSIHLVKNALQHTFPLTLFCGATARVPAQGVTHLTVK